MRNEKNTKKAAAAIRRMVEAAKELVEIEKQSNRKPKAASKAADADKGADNAK